MMDLLFGFQGRINRAKFWKAILIYIIAVIVISVIIGIILGVLGREPTMTTFAIIGAIIYIPILISGVAVGIKRLHDRNRSGWWLLVFYFVPNILQGIGYGMGNEGLGAVVALIGFAVSIWAIVELGILRGTIGANQYGPDPLPAGKGKYDE